MNFGTGLLVLLSLASNLVVGHGSSSLAQSSLKFAWDAYRALDAPSGENVFFSPYSIMNAMGMLLLGSSGRVETQLTEALRVPASLSADNMHQGLSAENAKLQSETEATIGVANRFFVADGSVSNVSPDYMTQLEDLYNSTLQSTPFATDSSRARALVNDFVSKQTKGELPSILQEDPIPNTILMLVNAIYFKGLWTVPFNPKHTASMTFHAKKGDISADFMWMKNDLPYTQCPDEKCEVVALHYSNSSRYAMHLIVPNNQDLETLEASLDAGKLQSLAANLKTSPVEIWVPRLSMKKRMKLMDMMASLGAKDLSSPQASDSKIFSSPVHGAFVDDILHEAKVEVDEKGTVAAGATSTFVVFSLNTHTPVKFDRPFLFYIADVSNGFVLFWGRVEDPSP